MGDQKNHCYVVESGGTEVISHFKQIRMEQEEEELARKIEEEQDPMKKTERIISEERKKEILNEYIESERDRSKTLNQMTEEEKFAAIRKVHLEQQNAAIKGQNNDDENIQDK